MTKTTALLIAKKYTARSSEKIATVRDVAGGMFAVSIETELPGVY